MVLSMVLSLSAHKPHIIHVVEQRKGIPFWRVSHLSRFKPTIDEAHEEIDAEDQTAVRFIEIINLVYFYSATYGLYWMVVLLLLMSTLCLSFTDSLWS